MVNGQLSTVNGQWDVGGEAGAEEGIAFGQVQIDGVDAPGSFCNVLGLLQGVFRLVSDSHHDSAELAAWCAIDFQS